MTFNLKTLSESLMDTEKQIAKEYDIYRKLEKEYWNKYNHHLLHSGMALAGLKQAEAKQKMMQEDIYDKFQDSEYNLKVLQSLKSTLIEVSRNMRSMAFDQNL